MLSYAKKYSIPAVDYRFPTLPDYSTSTLTTKSKRKSGGVEIFSTVKGTGHKNKLKVDLSMSQRKNSSNFSMGSTAKLT